jgi:hypothetical protein
MTSSFHLTLLGFFLMLVAASQLAAEPLSNEDSIYKTIRELRKEKGKEYTQQLSALVQQLDGENQQIAREALYDRMCRMKSKTLRNKIIANDDFEVRRAAIRAIENKNKTELISDLIELLTDPDPKTRILSSRALKSLTDHEIKTPIFADANKRSRVQSQWTQWWEENRNSLESAGKEGGNISTLDETQKISSQKITSRDGNIGSKSARAKSLAKRIGGMKLNSGSGKKKDDYFVFCRAKMNPNQGVADIKFMVRQGQDELAEFLTGNADDSPALQNYTQWHIFERHQTKHAADDALERVRQTYDQYSRYRNRMRQMYNVRNTRRC